MSQRGSNAGFDARSDSHHRRNDHQRASLPYRSDRDDRSITSYSTTSVRVTSKKGGPPISMNTRHNVNGGLSSHGRSRSRSGSIRTLSEAPDATVRPLSHRSENLSRGDNRPPERHHPLQRNRGSVTNERPESVSSDGTARPAPKHRTHGRDTDSQEFDGDSYASGRKSHTSGKESYTSGRKSHTSERYSETSQHHEPSAGSGSLYEDHPKKGHRYAPSDDGRQSRHTDRVARSESERTTRPSLDDELLSKHTESLSLHPRDPTLERVAKWNEEVKRDTKEDRWDGDPKTGLRSVNRSVNGEDHYGKGSNPPSHRGYPQSRHSERRYGQPKSDADSYSRSDTSRKSYIPPHPGSFAARYAPSETESYTLRNSPPPYRRGPYDTGYQNFGVEDHSSTYVTTNIGAPNVGFMDAPSKRQIREMMKHQRDRAMIERGLPPPVEKGFWD
ncbi:uncharacterized protein Bfra_011726 [Botrytis fragariae]|uniref:Uncharacterized protein n=1 Tax=Botrytis fragariae TaxID=1964551 RepID=A0A8H6AK31_9HELO|nr:uncharacterized protein Bfra_011726 [Botrytis fragariae]KAF5869183.1 hypothetical protein Bfra_011726 [Botrytis fragariae]